MAGQQVLCIGPAGFTVCYTPGVVGMVADAWIVLVALLVLSTWAIVTGYLSWRRH